MCHKQSTLQLNSPPTFFNSPNLLQYQQNKKWRRNKSFSSVMEITIFHFLIVPDFFQTLLFPVRLLHAYCTAYRSLGNGQARSLSKKRSYSYHKPKSLSLKTHLINFFPRFRTLLHHFVDCFHRNRLDNRVVNNCKRNSTLKHFSLSMLFRGND